MFLKSLSVILPAYNEEANIGTILEKVVGFLSSVTSDFEIIVIDDGSTDKTAKVLRSMQESQKFLQVIYHTQNRGYGVSLRQGFERAGKDLVFMMDTDQQFDVRDIVVLAAYIEDYDLVVGCRVQRKDPFYRVFYSQCYNCVVRRLFGIEFQDTNCGFKLFKRRPLQEMALFSTGSLIGAEILAVAQARHLKIKQVPVPHYPRLFGRPTGASPKVIFTILVEMYRLRRSLKKSAH